jgi:hypothetical protein
MNYVVDYCSLISYVWVSGARGSCCHLESCCQSIFALVLMDYGAGSLSRVKDRLLRQCVVISILETRLREGGVEPTDRAAVVRLDALLCAFFDEPKLASLS